MRASLEAVLEASRGASAEAEATTVAAAEGAPDSGEGAFASDGRFPSREQEVTARTTERSVTIRISPV